jgi:hypothetical protein
MMPRLNVTPIGKRGWLLATCKELPEVFVHGPSIEVINERAPGIIQRALERRSTAEKTGQTGDLRSASRTAP